MSTADPTGEGGGGGGGENAATTKVDRNASPSTPTTDTGGVPVQSSTVQQQHPPPSPLSGCYLLVVLPEPHTVQHKDLILNRLAKGKSVNDPSARTNRHSPIANWSARSLAFPLARRSLRCLPRWKVGGHARGCERVILLQGMTLLLRERLADTGLANGCIVVLGYALSARIDACAIAITRAIGSV